MGEKKMEKESINYKKYKNKFSMQQNSDHVSIFCGCSQKTEWRLKQPETYFRIAP